MVRIPSEPVGGTWIGANDRGNFFALINWYAIPATVKGEAITRVPVVRSALPITSAEVATQALARLPLDRIRPFRLIGVFAEKRQVREWQ